MNNLTFQEYFLHAFLDELKLRSFLINFEQQEWRTFFQNNSNAITNHCSSLKNQWVREAKVEAQVTNIIIRDLANIVKAYEY